MSLSPKIILLYTNIGRGHPFYLDGIADTIDRGSYTISYEKQDVFCHSKGLSRLSWQLARYLYLQGGKENFIAGLYKHLRTNNGYNDPSMMLTMLGKSLRKRLKGCLYPVVVAHPILVAILHDICTLFYQHGEIITPAEAVVRGASGVFAPLRDSLDPFRSDYYNDSQLIETGLCIEPSLAAIAESLFHSRLKRFKENNSLTVAFYSSGAEPIAHVRKIVFAVKSIVEANHKAIVFAKAGGYLSLELNRMCIEQKISIDRISEENVLENHTGNLLLVEFSNRADENRLTTKLFPQFDLFVAPSHERVNWAVGLGLPLLILDPPIGPFAPLNRTAILHRNVGLSLGNIEETKHAATLLDSLKKSGKLETMSKEGFGKHPTDGFKKIADFLDNFLTKMTL